MSDLRALAAAAVERGNWIIRADRDGVSYGGFGWNAPGAWTEAPDWDPEPVCGGGLHGQDREHGGYIEGTRLLFCDYDPEAGYVALDDEVKVRRARILLVDELPEGLTVGGSLNLPRCTGLTRLPEGLTVGGWLNLFGCTGLTSLPEGLKVGGSLNLSGCTGLTALPDGLTVGGSLNLSYCPGLTSLPEGLTVGGWLNLSGCTGLTALPEGLTVGEWLDLSGCTGITRARANFRNRIIGWSPA